MEVLRLDPLDRPQAVPQGLLDPGQPPPDPGSQLDGHKETGNGRDSCGARPESGISFKFFPVRGTPLEQRFSRRLRLTYFFLRPEAVGFSSIVATARDGAGKANLT
jgi:hypothetical protein